MSELDAIRTGLESSCRELVRTLEKTPDDKGGYKPTPTCNSTLEVLKHVVGANEWFAHFIVTGEAVFPPPEVVFPDSLSPARERLKEAHGKLLSALDTLTAEQLDDTEEMPWGETETKRELWNYMAGHYMWHAGQVAYIQTALGIMDY
jgi:uncharacterized damage-inducible protein DinB